MARNRTSSPNVPGVAKPLPFHALSSPIRDPRMEGLDQDGLHRFSASSNGLRRDATATQEARAMVMAG